MPSARQHRASQPRILSIDQVRRLAPEPVDRGVAAVARLQRGSVSAPQLRALGVTPTMVRVRERSGRLHRIHRGVYLVGHESLDAEAQIVAALLAAGPNAFVSHGTAAWLRGLVEAPPALPHLTIVGGARRPRAGFILHRTRVLDPEDVMTHRGLPITTPARLILDIAETASPDRVARVLGEAEARKLITRPELVAAMPRWKGRAGLRVLRELLADDLSPHPTLSVMEDRWARFVRVARLGKPLFNAKVAGRRRDVYWPEEGVVVELDSWDWHGDRAAFERDRRNDAELAALGIRGLRVTWRRLDTEPLALAAEVGATLAHGRAARHRRDAAQRSSSAVSASVSPTAGSVPTSSVGPGRAAAHVSQAASSASSTQARGRSWPA